MIRGNCYYASEALYHLLGGKAAGWKPMRIGVNDMYEAKHGVPPVNRESYGQDTHWFLQHETGMRIDITAQQFPDDLEIPYSKAIGSGFLTKAPSRKATALMDSLLWQECVPR